MNELTLAEAAAQLGLSPVTLKAQVYNGKLKARLWGRRYIVTQREVDRYRREHQRDPEIPMTESELRLMDGNR
jgi:excisionase family DNA binding protein